MESRLYSNKGVRWALVPRGGCDWLVSVIVCQGSETYGVEYQVECIWPSLKGTSRVSVLSTWLAGSGVQGS